MKYIIALLLIAVGIRLGFFYFFPLQLQNKQSVRFEATLLKDPKILGNTQEFLLRYGNFWTSTPVTIQAKADRILSYGQTLVVTGTIKDKLLKSKQLIKTIQNPQIKAKNSGFLPPLAYSAKELLLSVKIIFHNRTLACLLVLFSG